MAICLGGTHEAPRTWVRFTPDGDTELDGRVEGCPVAGRRPVPRLCYGCPAFIGVDREGAFQGMDLPNGEMRAMSLVDYESWQDDPEAFWQRQANGSPWTLRHSDTLEWDEHWAAYQRAYYARMTDEQKARKRESVRLAVARLRARRRNLNPHGGHPSIEGISDSQTTPPGS